MDLSFNQILLSVGSTIPIGALFLLFVKNILNTNDDKHKYTNKKLDQLENSLKMIELQQAQIQGEIKQVMGIRDDFKGIEKEVWHHSSQLKAAWRILDKTRTSDLCKEGE